MTTPVSLAAPATDLASFSDRLSQAWGIGTGASAAQYVHWSVLSGLIPTLASRKFVAAADLRDATTLSAAGFDSLIPILRALGVVEKADQNYGLSSLGKDYFVSTSPYYVGPGLFWGCDQAIPDAYLRIKPAIPARPFQPPPPSEFLPIQLSRNLASGVCAVRSGRFCGVKTLVDIGGGAGAIAIPFALEYPDAKVILVDLPQKGEAIQQSLRSFHVNTQVAFRAADVFVDPWDFPPCDGIVLGNFLHVFDDQRCRVVLEKCAATLPPDGRIWLHEVLFDEDKAGPMIAALWNANMQVIGGRQRTAMELAALLESAGFKNVCVTPTAARFSLVEAVRS